MKDKKNKATPIPSRQRYIHMVIKLDSIGSKIMLSTMSNTSLVELLMAYNFVSQKILEKSLYNLRIIARDRLIVLQNFDGQLERDSQGIPYWNVYLQTTALITTRCLAKAISKDLFKTNQSVDSTLKIHYFSNFQRCQREKLFSIPNSDFYPGYSSQIVLQFEELLQNDQVQEAITCAMRTNYGIFLYSTATNAYKTKNFSRCS